MEETARLEDAVQSPRAFMFIADDILGKRSNAYKALKEANLRMIQTFIILQSLEVR